MDEFNFDEPDLDFENMASKWFSNELQRYIRKLARDPTTPCLADGPDLYIGFDAEWVFDPERGINTILSIQLYVPEQPAIDAAVAGVDWQQKINRVVFAKTADPDGRPCLMRELKRIVLNLLDWEWIVGLPKEIVVVGFGLRFDLKALGDFSYLKDQVDSVSGKVATVGRTVDLSFQSQSFCVMNVLTPILCSIRFVDILAHVPEGTRLSDLGAALNCPKLTIPAPYSIERMDEYLQADPAGFEAYAMRDAEIAVKYALRLLNLHRRELGIHRLLVSASAVSQKWYLKTLEDAGIDYRVAFGLQQTVEEYYHKATKKRRTKKRVVPIPELQIQDRLLKSCYFGGRNECFWIGPTPIDDWYDYDLAGAYSTGMMDLGLIDFRQPRFSANVDEYCRHIPGFAQIKFRHPPEIRFPIFAVDTGSHGLVFPRAGETYATAAEIQVAHALGCGIEIAWGVIYPWLEQEGDVVIDEVATARLFAPFVKAVRRLRDRLKQEAGGSASLEEQAIKLSGNGLYGKTAQALREKRVFDTRQTASVQLPPSKVTHPAFAAYTTGFIRAIMAEILNRLPPHRTVLSVTTDGFLTNATWEEIDLTGPLCQRFQGYCEEVLPGSRMLEVKHGARQIVCMKNRGQLTAEPHPDLPIVLAKAGVQVTLDPALTVGVTGDAFKRMQNTVMMGRYLDREPGEKVAQYHFPSIRDQWEKGVDLVKKERSVALSLEPDFKRCPIEPRLIEIPSWQRSHLALSSRPWDTVEAFAAARVQLDQWREKRCLKTLDDWYHYEFYYQMSLIRVSKGECGERSLNRVVPSDLDPHILNTQAIFCSIL